MKSLVYLITSSELRRLDVDSEGACAGREGELPLDRERGARKRTKSCRRGAARARARRKARARGGRGALESVRVVYARVPAAWIPWRSWRRFPRWVPCPPGGGRWFPSSWLVSTRAWRRTKSLPSLCRRGANSAPKRPTNDTRGRRSGAGRVLRGRLDLPSARTRPEAATNAARRMTSHRRKHFTIAPVSKKLATARLAKSRE